MEEGNRVLEGIVLTTLCVCAILWRLHPIYIVQSSSHASHNAICPFKQ